jgi:hypothetical protein
MRAITPLRSQFLPHPADVFSEAPRDRGDGGLPIPVELARHGQHLDRLLQRDVRVARCLDELGHGGREEALLEQDLLRDRLAHLLHVAAQGLREREEFRLRGIVEEPEVVRAGRLLVAHVTLAIR